MSTLTKLFGLHELRYHLLRIGDGKIWHVNSIWEGYNSDGYPDGPTENRLRKYHEVKSISDVRKVIKECDGAQAHYLMVKFDYKLITKIPEFIEN